MPIFTAARASRLRVGIYLDILLQRIDFTVAISVANVVSAVRVHPADDAWVPLGASSFEQGNYFVAL
jgi:hypothetical protein